MARKRREAKVPKIIDDGLVIHEANDVCLAYGARVWDAGAALAKFFVWHRPAVRDRSILELGSGTGVVGLTLARLGALVTLTDYDTELLELIERNIAANALGLSATARRLDFDDTLTYLRRQHFDMIVAADVLYSDIQAPNLARTLRAHIRDGRNTEVFLAFQFRSQYEETILSFFRAALAFGFYIERLEDGMGRDVGSCIGQPAEIYGQSRFVTIASDKVVEVLCNPDASSPGPQLVIIRLTLPSASTQEAGNAANMEEDVEICPHKDILAQGTWVVVGGHETAGIIVRQMRELTSPICGRLATGARVEAEQLVGHRMFYQKLSGEGPDCGWVSCKIKGLDLLKRE